MKRPHVVLLLLMAWTALRALQWFFHGGAPAELTGTVIIIFLIAYEIWILDKRKARRRREKLANTFKMWFFKEAQSVTLSLGSSFTVVFIGISEPVMVHKFNIRCVAGPDGGNVAPHIVRIAKVTLTGGAPTAQLIVTTDGEGGMHCQLVEPCKFYGGEAFNLTVDFNAKEPWTGYLSFKGFDSDDQPCSVRRPITFIAYQAAAISDAGSASSAIS